MVRLNDIWLWIKFHLNVGWCSDYVSGRYQSSCHSNFERVKSLIIIPDDIKKSNWYTYTRMQCATYTESKLELCLSSLYDVYMHSRKTYVYHDHYLSFGKMQSEPSASLEV